MSVSDEVVVKRLLSILLVFLIAGCATRVARKDDLFNPADLAEKECYKYDSNARNTSRNMGSSMALGLLTGLIPPLAVITVPAAIVAGAADQASLPVKCGLTIDDAVKEAWTMAYFDDSITRWVQNKKENEVLIIVKEKVKKDPCTIFNIEIQKASKRPEGKHWDSWEYNAEVCKDADGAPQLTKEVSEEEIKIIKQQIAQQKCQEQPGGCNNLNLSYP